MKQIIDWITGKFQQPLSALFVVLGGLLLLLGIVTSVPLPFAKLEVPDPLRTTAIALGIGFIVFAVLTERSFLMSKPLIEEIPVRDIQARGKDFAAHCDGEMHWFNVPLGRCIPPHFEQFLKPAIDNDRVTRIVFMLDQTVKPTWDQLIAPAVKEAELATRRLPKVTVLFHDFKNVAPVRHNMAFKVININSLRGSKPEAHVFFYDESWMRQVSIKGKNELLPQRMLSVKPGSELFAEIKVLCDSYCFESSHQDPPVVQNGRSAVGTQPGPVPNPAPATDG